MLLLPIAVIAALVVGVVVGLWIKPVRLEFCSKCGASMGCVACREVKHEASRF